jgi:hypothetical protein
MEDIFPKALKQGHDLNEYVNIAYSDVRLWLCQVALAAMKRSVRKKAGFDLDKVSKSLLHFPWRAL